MKTWLDIVKRFRWQERRRDTVVPLNPVWPRNSHDFYNKSRVLVPTSLPLLDGYMANIHYIYLLCCRDVHEHPVPLDNSSSDYVTVTTRLPPHRRRKETGLVHGLERVQGSEVNDTTKYHFFTVDGPCTLHWRTG